MLIILIIWINAGVNKTLIKNSIKKFTVITKENKVATASCPSPYNGRKNTITPKINTPVLIIGTNNPEKITDKLKFFFLIKLNTIL